MDAVTVAGAVAATIIAIGGAVAVLWRAFTTATRQAMQPILTELRPNGGFSFRDEVVGELKVVKRQVTQNKNDIAHCKVTLEEMRAEDIAARQGLIERRRDEG